MTSKRIILSIPQQILEKLNEDKKKLVYTSHQEVILQILRDHYFKPQSSILALNQQKNKKEKRGRPPKLDELKILSAKRIFSKRGKPYEI